MKTFALPALARLKVSKTTPHKEHHGPDLVQAVSLRLRWETTNEHLATLHPNLKDCLFWRPPQVDAQDELPDLPTVTPCLRVPSMALPIKVSAEWTGYTMTIEHGIDESTALELYNCSLSKFAVDAKEGGTVTIDWSMSSNKQITPELVGILCGLEGTEVVATLTPPAIATAETIDGTQEAYDRDIAKGRGEDGQADLLDATDLHLAHHGAGADVDGDED